MSCRYSNTIDSTTLVLYRQRSVFPSVLPPCFSRAPGASTPQNGRAGVCLLRAGARRAMLSLERGARALEQRVGHRVRAQRRPAPGEAAPVAAVGCHRKRDAEA